MKTYNELNAEEKAIINYIHLEKKLSVLFDLQIFTQESELYNLCLKAKLITKSTKGLHVVENGHWTWKGQSRVRVRVYRITNKSGKVLLMVEKPTSEELDIAY